MTTAVSQQTCPECGAQVVSHTDYVTWCKQCNWNLHPSRSMRKLNIFEKVYESLGKRQSDILLEQFKQADALQPRLSFSKVMAFLLATAVYAFMLGLFVLGIMLILGRTFIVPLISIPLGLACWGVVWLLRPRFASMPKELLQRNEAPNLYKLLDNVAQSLQTKSPNSIAVDYNLNASMGLYTWQQKQILTLGLPLWAILENRERIALLGHEVAHSVNGDGTRSVYIYYAFTALIEMHKLVKPPVIFDSNRGFMGILIIPLNLLLNVIAGLIYLVIAILIHLLWHDRQRAEYLADFLAAQVGGTEATIGELYKVNLQRPFQMAVQRYALNPDLHEQSIFAFLRAHLREVPSHEQERIKRVDKLEGTRLDVTHPPIANRIELLQKKLVTSPQIKAETIDWQAIEQELAKVEPRMQKKLIDWFKSTR